MVDINSMTRVTDDSEMSMAKSDLYNLAKNSIELYKLIKDMPELEGWTQAKITKAADYVNSVLNYIKYESRGQGMELNEMASSGGISSGAMATSPMPLGKKKIISREAAPTKFVPDSQTKHLEKKVRYALDDGDDYTAKQYAKMASTPEAKKYLAKIIRQAMYAPVEENWNVRVQSIPKPPLKLKKIVVKNPRGKTWTFDTEAEARSMFPDSWDKIKAGLPGFEVTGLNEEAVWDKPNPVKKHKKLSPAQKSKAKARAKAAGRKYPNMVDNIWAAKN